MSNTFKGTPGPWKVDKNLIFSDDFFQTHIAKITPTSFNAETRKANAQLISCAPAMLEMLIKLNSVIDTYNNDMTDDNLKKVNKTQRESLTLIARATTI